jgi:hypothetical protein
MVDRNGPRFVDEGGHFFCWSCNRFAREATMSLLTAQPV